MPTEYDKKLNSFLSPLSFLYGMGVRLRNQLFNWGVLPSERYPVPVICIGNLAVGGTGKTPHTEYLIRILKDQFRVAVLSRGYKRKTSGFILAGEQSTSREIGDEPYQIKRKFPGIQVAVDANRRRGIQHLLNLPKGLQPEVILLDDAFQHRYVVPSLSIVLTDYNRLFYYDKLMPVGLLREPASAIRRADMVIVTKCDEGLKPIEYRIIEEDMKLLAHQLLHFTHITYGEIEPLFPNVAKAVKLKNIGEKDDVLLISGIASPHHFIHEVKKYSEKTKAMIYPDHHAFSKADFRKMKETFDKMTSPGKLIVVTEKDAARIQNDPHLPDEWKSVLYYLPIRIKFCLDKNFEEEIKKHITNFQRNSILR